LETSSTIQTLSVATVTFGTMVLCFRAWRLRGSRPTRIDPVMRWCFVAFFAGHGVFYAVGGFGMPAPLSAIATILALAAAAYMAIAPIKLRSDRP